MAQLVWARINQWSKGRGFKSLVVPIDLSRLHLWARCVTCRSCRKLMLAHLQQGFPCIYAKQAVSHKSQTAGQAAMSCGSWVAFFFLFLTSWYGSNNHNLKVSIPKLLFSIGLLNVNAVLWLAICFTCCIVIGYTSMLYCDWLFVYAVLWLAICLTTFRKGVQSIFAD